MVKINKEKFINRFLDDQHIYRMKNGFYNTTRAPNGKVIFTISQLENIFTRFNNGESMTSIGKSYSCSRQTIRENIKKWEGNDMPLPEPSGAEKKNDFIARCMEDSVMQKEFPSRDQRLAVCVNQWEGKKK
jgi:hypothetical protein